MSKKSATLIPKIIQAGNTEQAINKWLSENIPYEYKQTII